MVSIFAVVDVPEIAPPVEFLSLKGNQILEQSQEELPEPSTESSEPTLDLSRAEQAFLDGLDEMDDYDELTEEPHAKESH